MTTTNQERPIRVCQVITHLDVGGATQVALNSCAHLDRERFAPWLVSGPPPPDGGDAMAAARALGVEVVTLDPLGRRISPVSDARAFGALRAMFRERRPHVVHTHSSKAGFLGRLAARLERIPVVIHTVHGWSFHDHMPRWQRAAYIRLERRAARWTDALVTVCESDREKGLAAGIGSPDRYRLIHPVNDLAPFVAGPATRAAARARLKLPQDAPVVGTVGRLSDQKDPATFVRAAAVIAREADDAHFVIVGDGPLRDVTERLATRLGTDGRLTVTGVRDDVAELLPALDVFLLTSRWEGMPMVIPQAMASGVPVVATTVDGIREIVRDGENGLLVPPAEPTAIASRVVEVLRDRALRTRLAEGGRATAAGFGLDRTIAQLEQLYVEHTDARCSDTTAGSNGRAIASNS
jgi:glycosyltransferase involved in cell wall biosynthesis